MRGSNLILFIYEIYLIARVGIKFIRFICKLSITLKCDTFLLTKYFVLKTSNIVYNNIEK